MRMRTRSPFLASMGWVPGKLRPLKVNTFISVISLGSGRLAPTSIFHSLSMNAKSRSGGFCSGSFGWMMNSPIMPSCICVISS